MDSDERAKRLKVSHSPITSPKAPQNVKLPSTPKAEVLLPPSIGVPTPSFAQSNPATQLLRSPRESLKRHELSPLMLPRIHTEGVDEEEWLRGQENSGRLHSELTFSSFQVDGRRQARYIHCLKPRFSRFAALEKSPGDLADIAVELDDDDDDDFRSIRVEETSAVNVEQIMVASLARRGTKSDASISAQENVATPLLVSSVPPSFPFLIESRGSE
jgi:hypothetical protein